MEETIMKHKLLLWVLLSVMMLTGCGQEKSGDTVIWGEDYTKSNAYLAQGDSCRLTVPFAYKGSALEVELIGVTGENTDKAQVDLNCDKEWDVLQNLEYRGYHLGVCGLQIIPTGMETVSVEEMTVNVNGEICTVHFTDPITYIPCEASEELYIGTSMIMIQTNNPLSMTFGIHAGYPVTLTGYELMGEYEEIGDVLYPDEGGSSCAVTVNGRTLDGNKRISLDAGMEATYHIDVRPLHPYTFSYNDFVIYYEDENGEEKKYISFFVNQWIKDEDDAMLMLKLLVDGREE